MKMNNVLRILSLSLLVLCVAKPASAGIHLPKIFSDNMVLQRESLIPVWGTGGANEKVTVSFHNQTKSTTAGPDGKWSVRLDPEKAGGPFRLIVKGENAIEIENVLVGEVWLCSGQSNMEWTVGQSIDAKKELAAADNQFIRQIKVSKAISTLPEDDIKEGGWQVSSPVNTKDFSGVAYFFARNLYRELKVPVGLINSSWGGTNIETWISREGFESSDEFREMIGKMPKVDLASIAKSRLSEKAKQLEVLQGAKFGSINSMAFSELSFDDSKLPELKLPGQWESQILGEFDGVVWLRKKVNLSSGQAGKAASLELAKVDDGDETFVNGVLVGATNQWDAKRKYVVPKGILQEGVNVIVVKVTDTGGGGGIYGDIADLKLVLEDSSISLAGAWKFQVESIRNGISENELPSLAYNSMVSPLIPYAFRGAIWYQGESNAGRAYQYRTAFPLLINDWRKKWNNNFPFYFVQLATFATDGDSNRGSSWAELREAQTQTLQLPNTGMVVATDIGNPKDIHPTNKQEVGRRMAALALNRTYKIRMIDSGPSFKSMKIEGGQAIVSFANIGGGLMTTGQNSEVSGFEIAGADQKFFAATAIAKGTTLIISCDKVTLPAAVRFGWKGDASANNLFNQEGFPAVPFRTDDWKMVTKSEKYQIAKFGNN